MLNRAMRESPWDTAMFAFHLMDQVARTQVFPHTTANKIGTLMMFAVRSIFARPAQLAATMKDLAAAGLVPPEYSCAFVSPSASKSPLAFSLKLPKYCISHQSGRPSLSESP